MESRPIWSHGKLCISTVAGEGLMQRRHPVARFELINIFADRVDDAGDVVSAVVWPFLPLQGVSVVLHQLFGNWTVVPMGTSSPLDSFRQRLL